MTTQPSDVTDGNNRANARKVPQLWQALVRGASFVFGPIFLLLPLWKWKGYLFTLHGRVGRSIYWTTLLIYFYYIIVVGAIIELSTVNAGAPLWVYGVLLAALVVVPVIVSVFAVGVRRLHDRNKVGGWWLFLHYFPWHHLRIRKPPQSLASVL